jgi:hypothetical protein
MFKSLSHYVTLDLIALTYLEAERDCKMRILSSRACLISSGDLIACPINIPFLKYSTMSNA